MILIMKSEFSEADNAYVVKIANNNEITRYYISYLPTCQVWHMMRFTEKIFYSDYSDIANLI